MILNVFIYIYIYLFRVIIVCLFFYSFKNIKRPVPNGCRGSPASCGSDANQSERQKRTSRQQTSCGDWYASYIETIRPNSSARTFLSFLFFSFFFFIVPPHYFTALVFPFRRLPVVYRNTSGYGKRRQRKRVNLSVCKFIQRYLEVGCCEGESVALALQCWIVFFLLFK